MRWLYAGALATAAALAHCAGSVTELVVVVDTDLALGSQVDEIEITIDDGAGFVRQRSARVAAPGETPLPLTLGVTAGDDANQKVTVRAIAKLAGTPVASASLATGFVEGESKLAHVSICRSCGATCATAEIAGGALPAWSGATPSAAMCSGPTDGDGGKGDAESDATGDGPDAGDLDGGDAGGPSLLAYWDFEEDAGTVAFDKSGNGRDIGYTGSTVKRGVGKLGGGLLFSRIDGGTGTGTLSCDAHKAMFGSSGTLSFWWRDDDDAPASSIPSSVGIFSTQSSGRDHFFVSRFRAEPAQSFTLGFQFKDLDATADDDYANGDGGTKFTVTKGEWTRIVVTWTLKQGTLRVGKGATATMLPFYRDWTPTDQSCFFGSHAVGALDDVRVYGRVLSEAEIADLP